MKTKEYKERKNKSLLVICFWLFDKAYLTLPKISDLKRLFYLEC